MKSLFIFLTMFGFAFSSVSAFSSREASHTIVPPKKTETVNIQTSAVCGMCKETITKALATLKGVKKVALNTDTKVVSVTFNPSLVKADAIRATISKAGYDADNIPADPKAYENLHSCCKKDAH